jgi:hypothetical protein
MSYILTPHFIFCAISRRWDGFCDKNKHLLQVRGNDATQCAGRCAVGKRGPRFRRAVKDAEFAEKLPDNITRVNTGVDGEFLYDGDCWVSELEDNFISGPVGRIFALNSPIVNVAVVIVCLDITRVVDSIVSGARWLKK